jgi:hypothetical protein
MEGPIYQHVILQNIYQIRLEGKQKECTGVEKQQTRSKPKHRQFTNMQRRLCSYQVVEVKQTIDEYDDRMKNICVGIG